MIIETIRRGDIHLVPKARDLDCSMLGIFMQQLRFPGMDLEF